MYEFFKAYLNRKGEQKQFDYDTVASSIPPKVMAENPAAAAAAASGVAWGEPAAAAAAAAAAASYK